jgi:hypothetical protein
MLTEDPLIQDYLYEKLSQWHSDYRVAHAVVGGAAGQQNVAGLLSSNIYTGDSHLLYKLQRHT